MHRGEIRRPELQRHEAVLFHTDAVLAGDRTARLDASGEDLKPGGLRALELVRPPTRIEEDERVEVAVAGVEDVRDLEPVSRTCVFHEPQDVGQPRAGDDAVLHVVIR